MRQHMETRRSISRFGETPESELPDDIREIYEKNREKIGFVPNVFRAYAKRPDHFRAFMAYHDVLMKGPGNLSRAEREAIVVAVSSENRCQYCMVAHGAAIFAQVLPPGDGPLPGLKRKLCSGARLQRQPS